jgi:transposase
MKRFIEGLDRSPTTLFPDCIDDYVDADNPVRAIDVFVDMLDLASLGFDTEPETTGRPGYHPAMMLKLYVYGYLNQVQSSRRLERECARNLELIWLTGRLAPDFKTIADFRRENLNNSGPREFATLSATAHAVDRLALQILRALLFRNLDRLGELFLCFHFTRTRLIS